jgi:hypothetical protein
MEVTTSIQLPEAEQEELSKILNCTNDNMAETLSKFCAAALSEYVSMFLGQKVFRRGSDINEHRLFLLITHALGNRIPDEQEVCRLFQTSATESRALIRAVVSKYQYQLRNAIEASVRNVIESARQEGEHGPYAVTVNSLNVVEELNRLLASIDGTLLQIAKKRGSVSTYEIAPSSYARLRERIIGNV